MTVFIYPVPIILPLDGGLLVRECEMAPLPYFPVW